VKVVIVSAGGHATVVADILLRMRDAGDDIDLVALVDDNARLHGTTVLGIPVVGSLEHWRDPDRCDGIIVAIGNNKRRAQISRTLVSGGARLATARHPSSVIAPDVVIGAGSMICAGVVVNPASVVGEGAILNTSSSIDHHNRIGAYAHIAPGVHLGGEVMIGDETMVGIGATVLPGISIGARVSIGAGAVVTRNVPDDVTVVGVPARVIVNK
jgi:sugar O-acyltransferase (sialic acid O-acetyltransferase NeuD family)